MAETQPGNRPNPNQTGMQPKPGEDKTQEQKNREREIGNQRPGQNQTPKQ